MYEITCNLIAVAKVESNYPTAKTFLAAAGWLGCRIAMVCVCLSPYQKKQKN